MSFKLNHEDERYDIIFFKHFFRSFSQSFQVACKQCIKPLLIPKDAFSSMPPSLPLHAASWIRHHKTMNYQKVNTTFTTSTLVLQKFDKSSLELIFYDISSQKRIFKFKPYFLTKWSVRVSSRSEFRLKKLDFFKRKQGSGVAGKNQCSLPWTTNLLPFICRIEMDFWCFKVDKSWHFST